MERVQALADHVHLLGGRVREAIAEAVAETLARLARDTADRLFGPSIERPVVHRYGYPPHPEADPWADPEPEYSQHYGQQEQPVATSDHANFSRALAAGLATAGWWLRRGQPWAAVGAGVAVAAAVAASGRLGSTGRAVTGAVADLLVVAVPLARRGNGRGVT
jgi:hypothetical protein